MIKLYVSNVYTIRGNERIDFTMSWILFSLCTNNNSNRRSNINLHQKSCILLCLMRSENRDPWIVYWVRLTIWIFNKLKWWNFDRLPESFHRCFQLYTRIIIWTTEQRRTNALRPLYSVCLDSFLNHSELYTTIYTSVKSRI